MDSRQGSVSKLFSDPFMKSSCEIFLFFLLIQRRFGDKPLGPLEAFLVSVPLARTSFIPHPANNGGAIFVSAESARRLDAASCHFRDGDSAVHKGAVDRAADESCEGKAW